MESACFGNNKRISQRYEAYFTSVFRDFFSDFPALILSLRAPFPNTLFNSLPPLISTILDKNFYEAKTLETRPDLYRFTRDAVNYPKYRFFLHVTIGVLMSLTVFYVCFFIFNDTRRVFDKICQNLKKW
jgi:hypothetical protein